MSNHIPLRTCLVTGKCLPQDQLQRFTVVDGKIVFDDKVPAHGRGGYIMNDEKSREILKNNPKIRGKIAHFMKVGKVEF